MYRVKDKPRDRLKAMNRLLHGYHQFAVLGACVHFEWVVKRAIVILGSRPTADIRYEIEHGGKGKTLKRPQGLGGYANWWRREVTRPRMGRLLKKLVPDWKGLTDNFNLRNKLIHGSGTCRRERAEDAVRTIWAAAEAIEGECRRHGFDLYERVRPRERPRKRPTG